MPIIGVEIIRTTDETEMQKKKPRKNIKKTNRDRQEQREKKL